MAPAAVGSGGGNWIREFCGLGETCHGGITPVGKKIQGSSGFGIRGTLGRRFLKELSSLEAEARREWIHRKKKKNPKIQLNDVLVLPLPIPAGKIHREGRSSGMEAGARGRMGGIDLPECAGKVFVPFRILHLESNRDGRAGGTWGGWKQPGMVLKKPREWRNKGILPLPRDLCVFHGRSLE